MKKKFLSEYFYNRISYLGVMIAILVFIFECILFGMDFLAPYSNVYLGLFAYVIMPPFLILGLLMIPAGAYWKKRDVRLGRSTLQAEQFTVDLANPSHRNALFIFVVGTVILLIMTAVGSYKAFHYTESVAFCGTTCHVIMKPEHTAYLQSPHARVPCVDCHIGSGADWYVHSKLSGVRQVFKTIQGTYERPIAVPVHDLRPAKETCEECHWPGKSFSAILQEKTYFSSEGGDVPPWNISLLMKVGGQGHNTSGIHAHMYNENTIYYVSDDEKRQKISWVKSVDASGKETIFVSDDSPYKNIPPEPEMVRRMDCIDCHSRPSHRYDAPTNLINRAMAEGRIDSAIPDIKSKAVAVMAKKYNTEKQAVEEIEAALNAYYKEKKPEYLAVHPKEVSAAVAEVVRLFKLNIFPEMKTRWDEYPDNVGHMIYPGCFRCHDGGHKAESGAVITRDCNSCHTIVGQGPADGMQKNMDGMPFTHPFFEDESWKEMSCHECHTGS